MVDLSSGKHFHSLDIAKVYHLHNSLSTSLSPSEANGGGWGIFSEEGLGLAA